MYEDDVLNKELWVATYAETISGEINGGSFGVLAGCFYLSVDDAWNAILNDIEQYSIGREDAKIDIQKNHYRATLFDECGDGMIWEVQKLKNF